MGKTAEHPKEKNEADSSNHAIERPLECTECRKPIHTIYTIISQQGMQKIGMCSTCPMLKKKMFGHEPSTPNTGGEEALAPVCCGSCGLTRDEVQMGSRLGCSLCYEIFHDEVINEIVSLEHLSNKLRDAKHSTTLHVGKTPVKQKEWDPEVTLVSLQQALQETLGREDYEQAAWLRDKIQALTKKQQETQHGKPGETEQPTKS